MTEEKIEKDLEEEKIIFSGEEGARVSKNIVQKSFNFPLSEERQAQLGREIAEKLICMRKIEAHKKDSAHSYKTQIDGLMKECQDLSDDIESGDNKFVECEVVYNKPEENTKTITRTDTGETWDEIMDDADKKKAYDMFNEEIPKEEPVIDDKAQDVISFFGFNPDDYKEIILGYEIILDPTMATEVEKFAEQEIERPEGNADLINHLILYVDRSKEFTIENLKIIDELEFIRESIKFGYIIIEPIYDNEFASFLIDFNFPTSEFKHCYAKRFSQIQDETTLLDYIDDDSNISFEEVENQIIVESTEDDMEEIIKSLKGYGLTVNKSIKDGKGIYIFPGLPIKEGEE